MSHLQATGPSPEDTEGDDRAVTTIGDVADRATISVTECAQLLGLGRSATYEAVRAHQIPSVKIGRRVLVPVPALLRWLGGDEPEVVTALDDRALSQQEVR